jgi:CubicO group peptidase (beta-lactamase class C family)
MRKGVLLVGLSSLLLPGATGCAAGAAPAAITHPIRASLPAPPGKAAVEERLVPIDGPRGAPTSFATLAQRMSHYDVPGLSVAVVHEGRIAWSAGYGVLKEGEPARVDADTLFQAASISKPVADLATLVLVQRGVLDLDVDVNRYLRSWRVPEDEFTQQHPVTLRTIMSHTSGLNVHGFSGYRPDRPIPTLTQILDGAPPANSEPIRVEQVPSKRYAYSGGGLTVMEAVLVDVSQKSFEELLQESVLRPLEMTRSTFAQPLPPGLHSNAARAHSGRGEPERFEWHVMPMHAAAGLWTTSGDLAKVIVEVQHAYAGQTSRVLTQASARAMLTREPPSPAGLGFFLPDDGEARRFLHNGSNPGYASLLDAYVERGEGVVVLANGGRADLLRREIVDALTRDLSWPTTTSRGVFTWIEDPPRPSNEALSVLRVRVPR